MDGARQQTPGAQYSEDSLDFTPPTEIIGAAGIEIEDLEAAIERRRNEWKPLPGPQLEAYHSKADELLYGGAAGGGKTDLLLGVARQEHRCSIIFRRVFPSLNAIVERSKAMYGVMGEVPQFDSYNESLRRWKFDDGCRVRFGSIQHDKNKSDYQGQAHDFYGFDEITEFTESMFRFVTGWNRSAIQGQRCRVIATGNPPCSADGDWVINYWGPWLDPAHQNPARPGELRWFTTIDGKDVERPKGDPFEIKGEIIAPRSRTFIPARVQDNPYLIEAGYVARLQALPEPLRSKLLYGDFTKGREDNPYQVIPSEWVKVAQSRWEQTKRPDMPMTALGVDAARGGDDKTVIAMRYGHWVDELKSYPGASTPDGPAVATLVMSHRRDNAVINVDVVGVGTSVYDHLKGMTDNVVPINGAEKSRAQDKSGELGFVNLRAELYWKIREALDPTSGQDICLPPDRELLADLCAPTWELTVRGIKVEAKEDIIRRIGRSPDKGDAVAYALAIKTQPGMGLFNWAKEKYERMD
jgi:hypothetical protein